MLIVDWIYLIELEYFDIVIYTRKILIYSQNCIAPITFKQEELTGLFLLTITVHILVFMHTTARRVCNSRLVNFFCTCENASFFVHALFVLKQAHFNGMEALTSDPF